MQQKYADFLSKSFLFAGMDESEISRIAEDTEITFAKYSRNDVIYEPECYDSKLGFVLDGSVTVYRIEASGNKVPLNILSAPQSFGILTLFSKKGFPTTVMARTACKVLYIDEGCVRAMIEEHPRVSLNIIEFMAKKIDFLNDRIAAFSEGSVEDKLRKHLCDMAKKHGTNSFEFNKKLTSEALNCGRASLYRAIDSLVSEGLVTIENKKIYINDLNGLEGNKK